MDVSEGEESGWLPSIMLSAAVVFIVGFLVRRYFKGGQFTERVSAKGLVAVVTGSNCGIGFETVRELNLRKADVYLLCRSEERANEALRKRAAKEVQQSTDTVDILVNNAGIMYQTKYVSTKEGHELTWQSNHLGPFLLTELLLPSIKQSQYARIVNVSSMLNKQSGRINLETVDEKQAFGMMRAYNQSKLANVMHARALTAILRRAGAGHVTVNSVHPGGVDTPLIRHTFIYLPVIRQITAPFRWFFLKTCRDGAQTTLYVALSKKLGGVSGKYFADCKLATENPLALDDQACQDLYNYSREATGLS